MAKTLTADDWSVIRDALAYAGRERLGHGGAFEEADYLAVLATIDE